LETALAALTAAIYLGGLGWPLGKSAYQGFCESLEQDFRRYEPLKRLREFSALSPTATVLPLPREEQGAWDADDNSHLPGEFTLLAISCSAFTLMLRAERKHPYRLYEEKWELIGEDYVEVDTLEEAVLARLERSLDPLAYVVEEALWLELLGAQEELGRERVHAVAFASGKERVRKAFERDVRARRRARGELTFVERKAWARAEVKPAPPAPAA